MDIIYYYEVKIARSFGDETSSVIDFRVDDINKLGSIEREIENCFREGYTHVNVISIKRVEITRTPCERSVLDGLRAFAERAQTEIGKGKILHQIRRTEELIKKFSYAEPSLECPVKSLGLTELHGAAELQRAKETLKNLQAKL